jgi:hypothetical protein
MGRNRDRSGRAVKGMLIQGADGLWRAVDVDSAQDKARLADFVRSKFKEGFSRGEVTLATIKEFGWDEAVAITTLYRRVDKALLDGGIRAYRWHRKASSTRVNVGTGGIPKILEVLR